MGRRAPEARKARIVQAADTLFREKGYEDTSMSEVARRAGVAVGTVYLSYPDKASLQIGVIIARKREIAHLIMSCAPKKNETRADVLSKLIPSVFDLMLSMGPVGGPVDDARLERLGEEAVAAFHAVDDAIRHVFQTLEERGVARALHPQAMPGIVSGIMVSAVETAQRGLVPPDDMKAELLDTFERLFAVD